MNATIMKGERSKLLAVAVVIAMVACALVAFMPTSVAETDGADPTVSEDGATATVYDAQGIRDVIAGIGETGTYQSVSTIVLANDIDAASVIILSKNVTFDGQDHKITALESSEPDGVWTGSGSANKVISIQNADVTLKNLTVDSKNLAYGVNIYCTTAGVNDVTVDTVTSINSVGAGFIVNGVDATLNNVIASGNAWGSINVDKGASLTLTGTGNNLGDGFQVYSEDDAEIITTGSNYAYDDADRFAWGKGNTTGYAMILDGVLNADVVLGDEDAFRVNEGQTLTVSENVTLTNNGSAILLAGGTINGAGTINGDAPHLIDVYYTGGSVTGVTIDYSDCTSGAIQTYAGVNGAVTIDGVKFVTDTAVDHAVYINDTAEGGSVTIENCSFDMGNTASLPVNVVAGEDTKVSVSNLDYTDSTRTNKVLVQAIGPVTLGSEGNVQLENADDIALWDADNNENNTFTVAGEFVIDSDLRVTTNGKLVIPEGSTTTVADGATFYVDGTVTGAIDNHGSVVLEAAADVGDSTIGGDISVAEGVTKMIYPYMPTGTLFPYNGMMYEIFHVLVGGVEYQYGLCPEPIKYDGYPILNTTVAVGFEVFADGEYDMTNLGTTVRWYNTTDNEYVGQLKDSDGNIIVDAGFYEDVIYYNASVRIYNTTDDSVISNSVPIQQFLGFTIEQKESQVIVSKPTDSPLESVTLDSEKENIYKITGTLVYDNGYTLVVSVAPGVEGITLTDQMFDANFSNGTLTFWYEEAVPATIEFRVDFDGSFDDTVKPNNWTTETYTLDLSGLKLDRDAQVDIWTDGADQTLLAGNEEPYTNVNIPSTSDLYFGETEADGLYALGVTTTPYVGDRDYQFDTVFAGGLKYIQGTDRYYLPIQISGLLEGATVQIGDGSDPITVEGGEYNFIYRITDESSAIWIYIDQGAMYDQVKYRVDFTQLQLQSAVEITNGDETDYYGKAPTDLGTIETTKNNGFSVAFSGTLNYLTSYPGYNAAGVVGWFLPFDVNPVINGTDIAAATGTIGDNTASDIGKCVIRLNTPAKTFTVDLDGAASKYIETDYALDFSDVTCTAVAGYDEDAEIAWKEIQGLGFTGVPQSDVADKTMYIVFNPMGNTSGTYKLDFNDQPLTIRDGEDGWSVEGTPYAVIVYFTFDDTNEHWNGNQIQTGRYTVTIINDADVTLGTADVAVGGLLDAGYNQDASEVLKVMDKYGIFEGKTPDVIDRTFYLIWNNESALVGDYTGYLYYEGETDYLYSEGPVSAWNSEGVHSWYFSFDDQLAENSVPFREGTYYLVITSSDRENAILDVPVKVIDKNTFHVTINEFNTAFDDGNQDYDIEFDAKTGFLYSLPEGNFPGKTVDHWDLYIDGEFLRSYEPLGQIHFGYVFGAEEMGQNYEFRAHYADETGGDDQPVVIDPSVTIDMPGSAVANGEWVYYSVTTTKGTYSGNVMGYATAIPGAIVEYYENADNKGWVSLEPFKTPDGRYFFGNPSTGFELDNATSYFRVAFEQAGSFYITVEMADMTGKTVCTGAAAIEVVADSDVPVDTDQRTQYDVSAQLDGSILTVSVTSPQTAANYVNLHNAAFYYQITVEIGDDVYYLNNVIASRIIEGEYQYTDSQTIDLADEIRDVTNFAGAIITVQFTYDYGLTSYGADMIIIEDAIGDVTGYSDDATLAYEDITDALEGSGITIEASGVAPETVYTVFEMDAGEYTLTMETSDGTIVYMEAANFANDGTHIWYFSLQQGQPSWSSDYALIPLVEGAVQDGVTYDLRINGTLIGQITL